MRQFLGCLIFFIFIFFLPLFTEFLASAASGQTGKCLLTSALSDMLTFPSPVVFPNTFSHQRGSDAWKTSAGQKGKKQSLPAAAWQGYTKEQSQSSNLEMFQPTHDYQVALCSLQEKMFLPIRGVCLTLRPLFGCPLRTQCDRQVTAHLPVVPLCFSCQVSPVLFK